jgi:hypothetical protein
MAIAHSTSRGYARRNRLRSTPNKRGGGAIRVRGPLKRFLESERDTLVRACSLLKCVALAMECYQAASGPYFPDVLELAVDLLQRRAANLDQLLLDARVPATTQSHLIE